MCSIERAAPKPLNARGITTPWAVVRLNGSQCAGEGLSGLIAQRLVGGFYQGEIRTGIAVDQVTWQDGCATVPQASLYSTANAKSHCVLRDQRYWPPCCPSLR
jgi:hypothetical protein